MIRQRQRREGDAGQRLPALPGPELLQEIPGFVAVGLLLNLRQAVFQLRRRPAQLRHRAAQGRPGLICVFHIGLEQADRPAAADESNPDLSPGRGGGKNLDEADPPG